MSSSTPPELPDLEADLPTTAEDVAVLARLRPRPEAGLLTRIELLQPPDWLPPPRDRARTSAGWEPFEL